MYTVVWKQPLAGECCMDFGTYQQAVDFLECLTEEACGELLSYAAGG